MYRIDSHKNNNHNNHKPYISIYLRSLYGSSMFLLAPEFLTTICCIGSGGSTFSHTCSHKLPQLAQKALLWLLATNVTKGIATSPERSDANRSRGAPGLALRAGARTDATHVSQRASHVTQRPSHLFDFLFDLAGALLGALLPGERKRREENVEVHEERAVQPVQEIWTWMCLRNLEQIKHLYSPEGDLPYP